MIILYLIIIPLLIVFAYYLAYRYRDRLQFWMISICNAVLTLAGYGFMIYYLDREGVVDIGYGFYSYMFFLIVLSTVTISTIIFTKCPRL